MAALTTRQRDILRILLETSDPLGTAEIATLMNLSPRQVNYSLKGVKTWLAGKKIPLKITPGVGVAIEANATQTKELIVEFGARSSLQLILSAGQRQQLLALYLLTADEPLILLQLQRLAEISRATALKDLDEIEAWLTTWGISLLRKPNYGIQVESSEMARQQALASLVWGDIPFGESLTSMSHNEGLQFSLQSDAALLSIVQKANQILSAWSTTRVTSMVAYAEEQLGGRFTDDAVLYLTLVLAILTQRVQSGHHLSVDEDTLMWLKSLPVWSIAHMISLRIGWHPSDEWRDGDLAGIAMQLMAAPRSESWPGEPEREVAIYETIERLMEHISQVYNQPSLSNDRTLRAGLVNHVVPACLRQRFQLWFPSLLNEAVTQEEYPFEHRTAQELSLIIHQEMGCELPSNEISNLALLLRAAYIRTRPYRFQQVIVVCPSGMATAQLLVARLEARFPRLGTLKVVSLRQLNPETAAAADLILTTVPLSKSMVEKFNVIQVHPLLLPADIDAITQFLS